MLFPGKRSPKKQPQADRSKPDLIEYLQTLPDVEVPYPPLPEKEKQPEPEGQMEKWKARIDRESRLGHLVSAENLTGGDKELEEMLSELEGQAGIGKVTGRKGTYYYMAERMTSQYAEIIMLVTEKDIACTIAEVTRKRSRYPATTPLRHFLREPYDWSREQLNLAVGQIRSMPEYQDIHMASANNGEQHFYSIRFISDIYGKALADDAEEEDM